ncbi:hypothetical protein A3J17_02950 [Candidatus Curtissbacteria bacterium RIFCSPLOWO2_02_FULL_40_11]|uniref:Uncharacterized protein n=1 Tax=Candidatus Curtissbacteria bacterium RIFCSPLOWO2_12_FULL_38_9 TaxID=1797735 RepID=A0A1F5IAH7_9BACT|nr:MAG: hypothetical protein A3J17_02950 [Candidatus Curtissbacteria bacterium RIFCSPLOWO2_02_FULL_40_11]OGE13310.1 MAG: hypothetical protein A3G14_05515 [Candidatus Curtissbacteria bacterium RIFCSPLOWO2_12_FULL_38_9]
MYLTVFLLFSFLFILPDSTYAYLDPGTGSYITQLMIGFIAGGLYLLKVYWQKIVSIFRILFRKPRMTDEKKKTNKRN